MSWRDRLSADPKVCHGKLCVRGTRVMVTIIIDNLAAGESVERICSNYHVKPEDVEAVQEYMAEQAKQ